ncbi:hypothetical protein FACS189418_0880 [Clostridia bacterium]|nr:hypothetical protein FACS189418_0880 [Clostridia bacterium]
MSKVSKKVIFLLVYCLVFATFFKIPAFASVKKAESSGYFYGQDGKKKTEQWVDRKYYVDKNGERLKNTWAKLIPAPGDTKTPNKSDRFWYFFNNKGERLENTEKYIGSAKYYLGAEGRMLTGWVGNRYYGGEDDGALKIGWFKINQSWRYFTEDRGNLWTPASVPSNVEGVTKIIGGKTYAFNASGEMLFGWVKINNQYASRSIENYAYFGSANDGSMKTNTWKYLTLSKNILNDDQYYWFYFKDNGQVQNSSTESEKKFVSIKGAEYLFDIYGRVCHGLQWIGDELYYLGSKDQCWVQKDVYIASLKEADGLGTFYFQADGRGLTGVRAGDDSLYYKGKLQKASAKEVFRVVSFVQNGVHQNYVVDSMGKIQRNATVSNGEGSVYQTNSSGTLLLVDRETPHEGVGFEPQRANP